MNIEELIIGDLVVYIDDETPVPVVVRKINGNDGIVCLRQSDGHMFNTMIDFLLPIPLTKEILEHNGFELDHNTYQFYKGNKEKEFNLTYWVKDSYLEGQNLKNESGIDFPCRYVHKLQHALKLMEIDKKITLP
jgi:hypothetical protein